MIFLRMILIIQNGYLNTKISKYLDEDYVIVKSYDIDCSKIDLEPYRMMIILGGHQSVLEISTHPYLLNVVELIKISIEKNIPSLGICLGSQLIAYALGHHIKISTDINLGYDTVIYGVDNIFRCHQDYIEINTESKNKLNIIEYFNNMPYLFTYKNLLGIQCHPDIPPEYVNLYHSNKICKQYAKLYEREIDLSNKILLNKLMNLLYGFPTKLT